MSLHVPMLIPRTANMPYFDGPYVNDFLQLIIQHGANSGITDCDDLVTYIVQYSSDHVKDIIRFMPEFDEEVTNKKWDNTKKMLIALYGSLDIPPKTNEEDLKDYCHANSICPEFVDKQAVDAYHRGFQKLAAPLMKNGLLTEKAKNFYFITGIPVSMKGNLTLKGKARRLRYWEPVLTAANEVSRVLGANPKTHNTHDNNQRALELSTTLTLLITEKRLYPLLSTGVV